MTTTAARGVGPDWRFLAWVETRRLLLHPAVVLAWVGYLSPWLIGVAGGSDSLNYAVLHVEGARQQVPALIMAVGLFLAVVLTSVQAESPAARTLLEALPRPPYALALARVVAVVLVAVVGGAIIAVRAATYATRSTSAGQVAPLEWATPILVTVLAGCIALLATNVLKSLAGGLAVLGALAVVVVIGIILGGQAAWLFPIAVDNPFVTPVVPHYLTGRPAGLHLLYLAALSSVAVGLLLYRNKLRMWLVQPAVAVVAVLGLILGFVQLTGPSDAVEREKLLAASEPSALQTCETREGVQYCFFPEFQAWVPAWSEIVEGQRAQLPRDEMDQQISVRQYAPLPVDGSGYLPVLPVAAWAQDNQQSGTVGAIPVSTVWSDARTSNFGQTAVLGFAVMTSLRLTLGKEFLDGDLATQGCGPRGAVMLWLALQSSSAARTAYNGVIQATTGGGLNVDVVQSSSSVYFGPPELALAGQMLDAGSDVAAKVADNWARISSGDADWSEVEDLVGVPAPAVPAVADSICS